MLQAQQQQAASKDAGVGSLLKIVASVSCRAIQAQYNELLHDPPPGINAGEHDCMLSEPWFTKYVLGWVGCTWVAPQTCMHMSGIVG
jgi:hypothetical protein